MQNHLKRGVIALALTVGAGLISPTGTPAEAQQAGAHRDFRTRNWIVPQQRCYSLAETRLAIGQVDASVTIDRQVATTTLRIRIDNPSAIRQEAELLLPVPHGAAVREFGLEGLGDESSAKLLRREEARRIYEEIVREMRDPGLLEFAGYNLVQSSVFPVEGNSSQTIHLTYEHVLTRDGDRVDYHLPRSEAIEATSIPWSIEVTVRSEEPISTVYSPSHGIVTKRAQANDVTITLGAGAAKDPGPFQISYLLERDGISASLVAYPEIEDDAGGGYFMLLAGLPTKIENADARQQQREVIIVIDRSGSMREAKIDQAREAAIQVLEGLRMGESFNIIDYSDTVARFSDAPVEKTAATLADARSYIKSLRAEGGTNIHGAMIEAVRQPVGDGVLPMVLFLTDGLATAGNTSEVAIRADTQNANVHNRRIFTFGVGYDVNAPLLDKLAETARGASINVMPDENIEVAVSTVFKRLAGPILSWPKLTAMSPDGRPDTRAIRDPLPAILPDLFEGGQLVVFGRYTGDAPVTLRLEGTFLGDPQQFDFTLDPDAASITNAFVPRLWATRRIARLIDEVRQEGANGGLEPHEPSPGRQEIVDEIVALSTRFGILTEYTAFLATETGDKRFTGLQWSREDVVMACNTNLDERAVNTRAGTGAVNQAMNIKQQLGQSQQMKVNEWYDADMNRVEVRSVCQIHDQTFFRRGTSWIDARLITKKDGDDDELTPDRVITFGSTEHFELARALAATGRQATIALAGDIYLEHDGVLILIQANEPVGAPAPEETK